MSLKYCRVLRQLPAAGYEPGPCRFFFTLVTGPRRSLSLKLNDTRVYAPRLTLSPDWWFFGDFITLTSLLLRTSHGYDIH